MWWLIGLAGVGVLYWLLQPAKPLRHKHKSITEVIPLLDALRMKVPGGVLIIEHEGSERFIQFAQRSAVIGSEHLLFGFPDAPWSREYFDRVVSRIRDQFGRCRIRETGEAQVPRFAEVDLWGDRDAVVREATALIDLTLEVLGLGPDDRFTAWVSGLEDPDRRTRERQEAFEQLAEKDGFGGWWARRRLGSLAERGGYEPPSAGQDNDP